MPLLCDRLSALWGQWSCLSEMFYPGCLSKNFHVRWEIASGILNWDVRCALNVRRTSKKGRGERWLRGEQAETPILCCRESTLDLPCALDFAFPSYVEMSGEQPVIALSLVSKITPSCLETWSEMILPVKVLCGVIGMFSNTLLRFLARKWI